MRTRVVKVESNQQAKVAMWLKVLLVGLVLTIGMGLAVREWQTNQVVGHAQYRFNMALMGHEGEVTFVSIDPSEETVLSLTFPPDLAIKSRVGGEYSIAALYKLGSYKGEGGKFARQKIQGFMRVPVPGYIVVDKVGTNVARSLARGLSAVIFGQGESSLSRFDAILLWYRIEKYGWRHVEQAELVRAGAIADNTYHPERLQEYVGARLFDWGIGESRVTVAIVNGSGENGLGSDMADFLSNLGMDVVMVRSVKSDSELDVSEWQVESQEEAEELGYIFQNLFGFDQPKVESISGEYRSKVLIRVGKDAKELF